MRLKCVSRSFDIPILQLTVILTTEIDYTSYQQQDTIVTIPQYGATFYISRPNCTMQVVS